MLRFHLCRLVECSDVVPCSEDFKDGSGNDFLDVLVCHPGSRTHLNPGRQPLERVA